MAGRGRRSGKRAFETRLNVLFSRLLSKELKMYAVSEPILRRDRPDITVFVNGVKVVLEGSYSKTDAENDVTRRIMEGFADLGIALFYKEAYPQNLTDAELEEKLKTSTFEVKLVVPEDVSDTLLPYFTGQKVVPRWVTGWMEAGVKDLVAIINEAIQVIISEEDVKQAISEIEQKIGDFVDRMRSLDWGKQLAQRLYELFYRLYGLAVGDYREIDELIYAKAALTILLSATFYQAVRAQIDVPELSVLCRNYGYRLGLRKAFEEILKVDYEPIYNLALRVVEVLPDELDQALKELVELAEKCASKRTLLRRDFAGKIYHKVVGDWSIRKNFATFFTTIPAAYLLAYLAVFTRTGVFSDFKENLKVGDLACGSGTLLTAAYNALKDLYIYSRLKAGEVDLKAFHKLMLEECIWGIDALRYAVQIASTNLALQDPSTQVRHMNTYTVPLGIENENVTLGSLEFLRGRSLPSVTMFFAESEGATTKFLEGAKAASITGERVASEIPEFDLIIMNPPFARSTGRGGRKGGGLFGFVYEECTRKSIYKKYVELRNSVQKQMRDLAKEGSLNAFVSKLTEDELYNIGPAGEGLLFLYLASKLVKEGGKIAFVLPKSLLTGVSWFLARCLLLEKFHPEHLVLSYDAENGYNFSESTSLSEVLVVARRRNRPEEEEETKITILLKKPTTSLEARALAFKILRTDNNEYVEINGARAYVSIIPRSVLAANLDNWGKLFSFPSHQLNMIANEIFSGKIYGKNLPITFLGSLVEVAGLAVRRGTFHDIFREVKEGTPGAIPAIIGGEEALRMRIAIRPNAKVICMKPKYLFTASKFLVPDRFRVNTLHAVALYCSEPVVANLFFGLRPRNGVELDENKLKALILWLNTTWGILSILANRTETWGGWVEITKTKWKLLPALNVAQLDEEIIGKLTRVFDKYSDKELRRLPDQFDPSDIDPVRKGIDLGFLDAMGIEVDEKALETLYWLVHENLKAVTEESLEEDLSSEEDD